MPSWGSVANPRASDSDPYLIAADGYYTAIEGAPFRLDRVPLDCGTSGPNGYAEYALSISAGASQPSTVVHMGETVTVTIAGCDMHFHNLRSFQPLDVSDDYWNWGYWLDR